MTDVDITRPSILFSGTCQPTNLAEVIGQAVGAGSMCWDKGPIGVFESERARQIVDEVVAWINENYRPVEDPESDVEPDFTLDEVVADFATTINIHSLEGRTDTPDFILATFLRDALVACERAIVERERWYGRALGERAADAVGDDQRAIESGHALTTPEGTVHVLSADCPCQPEVIDVPATDR